MGLKRVELRPGVYVYRETDTDRTPEELWAERAKAARVQVQRLWRRHVISGGEPEPSSPSD